MAARSSHRFQPKWKAGVSGAMQQYQLLIQDRYGFERKITLGKTLTLGRTNENGPCDVLLPEATISRSHLRLELQNGQWFVEDLKSTHGSYYRGERLSRAPFGPGTSVTLANGAYTLTLLEASTIDVNLHAIVETAQLLIHEVDLDEMLERSLDRLLYISGTDRGFIMLEEGGELVPKVHRNLSPELESEIHVSLSSVRSVFHSGEPIWNLDVTDDTQLKNRQSILLLDLKTILCLPLAVQGRRTGVVYLDSRRAVTKHIDRNSFAAIVAICAIAIERIRLSEENLKSQLLATVGHVSSSIVHDVKNGLYVIRGYAENLALMNPDTSVKSQGKRILEAVTKLTQMADDILEYAKVREPKREPADLSTYLLAIVDSMRSRADEAQVKLECHGESCTVPIDGQRFAA